MKIKEEQQATKILDSLLDMAAPPTMKPIQDHLARQICAASLIGIVLGKTVSITLTPDLKDDGLIHGFQAKLDAKEHLEEIGQMTIEEVLAKMNKQLAENIRRENAAPDMGNFLAKIFEGIERDLEDDGEEEAANDDAAAPEQKPQEQAAS